VAVSNPLANIQKIEKDREERRRKFEEIKQQKKDREDANRAAGRVCDVEFDLMVDEERKRIPMALNHVSSNKMEICVCVRKRPLFEKEVANGEIDSVTCPNPKVVVHEFKYKVDGITKFIQNSEFSFDNSYSEKESSHDLYKYQIKDLLP
jgi:kinesin family protein 2/24